MASVGDHVHYCLPLLAGVHVGKHSRRHFQWTSLALPPDFIGSSWSPVRVTPRGSCGQVGALCETLAAMNLEHLRGRVVAHVGLTVLALIFAGLVPFGFNLLVGRAYGPAVLGGISVVLGLALFLGQVPSTVGIAATKFMAAALGRGDESDARAIFQFLFTLNLGLTALLTGAMVVAAPWIHRALHVSVGAVLLGAALLLVYSLYLFFKSVYYGI